MILVEQSTVTTIFLVGTDPEMLPVALWGEKQQPRMATDMDDQGLENQ